MPNHAGICTGPVKTKHTVINIFIISQMPILVHMVQEIFFFHIYQHLYCRYLTLQNVQTNANIFNNYVNLPIQVSSTYHLKGIFKGLVLTKFHEKMVENLVKN